MTNELEITAIRSRLPMPQGMQIESGVWRVLCESIFPTARTPEAICMAMDYCRARKLDILKKPVHIVPMWSSSLGREVETVWPSIGEIQTTAARTKEYAGMDEPKWGDVISVKFTGVRKGNVGQTEVIMDVPEWCSVTVYRLVAGQKCAFTEPVYWKEAYGRIGKTELPNDQWAKRSRGMIIKVAKAFSLRAAFPEEGAHVAEEMEGRTLEEIDGGGIIVDGNEPLKKASPFKNATLRNTFVDNVQTSFREAKTVAELEEIMGLNKEKFDAMKESSNEHDDLAMDELRKTYAQSINKLRADAEPEEVEDFEEEEIADPLTEQFNAHTR